MSQMTEVESGEILSADQARNEQLHALCGVYQRTDRIICGTTDLRVKVESHPGMNTAAWTDGTCITLNSDQIDGIDAFNVERMHGVNFHEMSHVMFTPRRGTALVSWVMDEWYMQAFNILEDQRIESMLTTMYPSTTPWLSAAIARWVLAGDAEDTGYMFVRGRRYLDARLRGALRKSFVRQDLLPEVDRIIDEYRTLVFAADYERAKPLIADFNKIIEAISMGTDPGNTGTGTIYTPVYIGSDPNGHNTRPVEAMDKGRPKGVSDQRSISDSLDEGEDEVDPTEPVKGKVDDADDTEDDFGDFGHGFDDDEYDGPAGGAPSDPQPSESEQKGDGAGGASQGETTNGSDKGNGAGTGGGLTQIVKDIAEEVLSDVLNDPSVVRDIRRTQSQVRGSSGSDRLDVAKWQGESPMMEYATLLGKLRRDLRRLAHKADPGWNTYQSSGRVNPFRWMRDRDIETAFDVWDDGVHDAFDLEVVLLLDESGSMGSMIRQANNAMWAIKRALDSIGASTTVMSFDGETTLLYHRNDKATGEVRYTFRGGGTNPIEGISQAARIFAGTKRTQKIFILLTDGEWSAHYSTDDDGVNSDEYIKRFNGAGVVTALGFIVPENKKDYKVSSTHNCQITSSVSGSDLATFVHTIVSQSIKTRLVGR